jgi:hypothetical protein
MEHPAKNGVTPTGVHEPTVAGRCQPETDAGDNPGCLTREQTTA